MKKAVRIIVGLAVFIISLIIILRADLNPSLLPDQEVKWTEEGSNFMRVMNAYLYLEKIPMKKDYLSGIELFMANYETPGSYNNNEVYLANSRSEILYTYRISSDKVPKGNYVRITCKKKIYIGRRDTLYVWIYSPDGNIQNHISIGNTPDTTIGKFSIAPVHNNDIAAAMKGKMMPGRGNLAWKTYESNEGALSWLKMLLLAFALMISLVIIFFSKIRSWILKFSFSPEISYLAVASVAGLSFLVITPPFQVSDTNKHFFRSYQVSEINIFKFRDEVPASLIELASKQSGLVYSRFSKTSKKDILSNSRIKLDPEVRVRETDSPGYFIPYIPQAIGIAAGRLFGLSPLWLLYLARLFNLAFSIFIIYKAIKIVPVGKWIFFLLGVMPMTLYQCASTSYDALTISLSLYTMAWILNKILGKDKIMKGRDIVFLGLLTLFLALCKLPYFLIGFLFIFIPRQRIGGLKKYGVILLTLLISVMIGTQFDSWKVVFKPPKPKITAFERQINKPVRLTEKKQSDMEKTFLGKNVPKNISPPEQEKFILEHPGQFINILLKSAFVSGSYFYLKSFVGIFGWVTLTLPKWLIFTYILVMLFTALYISTPGITIPFLQRILFILIFFIVFFMLEAGFYINYTSVGSNIVEGVQGRYLIPFSPLLFLFFYNNAFGRSVNSIFTSRKPGTDKRKLKGKVKGKKESLIRDTQQGEQFFAKLWIIIMICLPVIATVISLFTLIQHYYILYPV